MSEYYYKENNMLDIDAIEARTNAATPPPWVGSVWYGTDEGGWCAVGPHHVSPEGEKWDEEEDDEHAKAILDAAFIAHAREDVPALIAWVRELEAAYAEAKRHEAQREEMLLAEFARQKSA